MPESTWKPFRVTSLDAVRHQLWIPPRWSHVHVTFLAGDVVIARPVYACLCSTNEDEA